MDHHPLVLKRLHYGESGNVLHNIQIITNANVKSAHLVHDENVSALLTKSVTAPSGGYSSAQVLQQHTRGCKWGHLTLVLDSEPSESNGARQIRYKRIWRVNSGKGKDKREQLVWPSVC